MHLFDCFNDALARDYTVLYCTLVNEDDCINLWPLSVALLHSSVYNIHFLGQFLSKPSFSPARDYAVLLPMKMTVYKSIAARGGSPELICLQYTFSGPALVPAEFFSAPLLTILPSYVFPIYRH